MKGNNFAFLCKVLFLGFFFGRDSSPLSSNGNVISQCSRRTALRGHSSNKAYTESRSKELWTFRAGLAGVFMAHLTRVPG